MNTKNIAFTLIELLVVIAVIGILSGLIVVSMNGVTNKATTAKSQVFSNSLRNALMLNIKGDWSLDASPNDIWNNATGTAVGSPTSVTSDCPQNTCYSFVAASSQYITTPNTSGRYSATTNPMTAMVWVKGSSQASKTVFANWDNTATTYKAAWKIYSAANGTSLGVSLMDSTTSANTKVYYTTTTTAFDNNWHLVGFSWSGPTTGVLTLYVDGNAIAAASTTKTTDAAISSLNANGSTAYALVSIACEMTSGSPTAGTYFNGSLDSARLYDAAVPNSQIKEQYYAGLNNLLAKGEISQSDYAARMAGTSLK